jgi:hypothetical protein
MNTEEQKLKAAMISKYEEMTAEEIVNDVMILVDKAIQQGLDAGFNLAKEKIKNNIQDWERKEIMKVMMGQL